MTERSFGESAVPRVIFHESLLDEKFPYGVAFSPEECSKFLVENGMPKDKVKDLNIVLTGEDSIWNDGTYNPFNRLVEIRFRASSHEFLVSMTLAHELKHAIDHHTEKSLVRKHYATHILGTIVGSAAVMTPSTYMLLEKDFDLTSAAIFAISVPVAYVLGQSFGKLDTALEKSAREFTKEKASKLEPVISLKPIRKVDKKSTNY